MEKTAWANYLEQFEGTAQANGSSDYKKVTALIIVLNGKALEVLQRISDDQQNCLVDRTYHNKIR